MENRSFPPLNYKGKIMQGKELCHSKFLNDQLLLSGLGQLTEKLIFRVNELTLRLLFSRLKFS